MKIDSLMDSEEITENNYNLVSYEKKVIVDVGKKVSIDRDV
jgi:hypothetical protein